MIVDDILDELSGIDDDCWADSIETILKILEFPIRLNYSCRWEEFVYERSGKLQYISNEDKAIISQCYEIALYNFIGKWYKRKLIAVNFKGSKRLRNETACDIYKIFKKIHSSSLFFIAYFDNEISFLGTTVDKAGRNEVIVSDWFGKYTNRSILDRIEEINFACFSDLNIRTLYGDYLWAIARPYIKYRESNMFLIFECGHIETYELFAPNPDGRGYILLTKSDPEETLRINFSYYKDIYGDDYFEDAASIDANELENDFEKDISDFEWTMLEMDLVEEATSAQIKDNLDDFEEADTSKDFLDEISNMNPEELLRYINDK